MPPEGISVPVPVTLALTKTFNGMDGTRQRARLTRRNARTRLPLGAPLRTDRPLVGPAPF